MMAALQLLDCVPELIRDTPRYVGDHVIRHYSNRTLSEIASDLGTDLPDPFEIVGGIGVLTMTAQGNTFVPAIPDKPPATEKTLPESAAQERRSICAACAHYSAEADKCQMCGCAGQMAQRATRPWASCPRGYWPSLGLDLASTP